MLVILWMFFAAMARSSSGGVAIDYGLPVLWNVMSAVGQAKTSKAGPGRLLIVTHQGQH